ncbi:MAG TPA: UvrD-helicase domain-containing protein, partial [Solirubrobacteraceae bacterium]|nr:UvrD-helicase domain-containing protein [Solirubrobacteraceae bacterium]
MSAESGKDIDVLLEGLNPPQRDAVMHGEGPLLILAGAGSGKTRVLTHRIAYLVHTGAARPDEILAITFTNKAAQEMRERVELLVGRRTRAMWVMTFHAACARMLRSEAPRLGYTKTFSIYDQADSRRLIKRCLDELSIDPKRFTPAAIGTQISAAKNQLRAADDYRELVSSFFEQTVADVYELYERELHRFNALDFDDLLVRAVNVLELFEEVRDRYSTAFSNVLVDEYQDTNHAQYRWLQLLAAGRDGDSGHRNLAVVGDDDQCLVEGTPVTMADGSTTPIERIRVGDEVLSGHGSGDFRPARVLAVHRSQRDQGIAITTESGRRIVSTPEHIHFAGYQLGRTPQLHMTYVMLKRGMGYRVGTSRTYTNCQVKPVVGVSQRVRAEHADAADEGLSFFHPHFQSQSYTGREGRPVVRRRCLTLTLCGEPRGKTPLHRIALFGYDDAGREALERLGLSVRPARHGSRGWRYETASKDMQALFGVVDRISSVLDVSVRCTARMGANRAGPVSASSLPFAPAASIRPGMVMFTEDGDYDLVKS